MTEPNSDIISGRNEQPNLLNPNADGVKTVDHGHGDSVAAGNLLIGRYKVLTQRKGGMGVVYQCVDTETGAVMALKTVQTDGTMSDHEIRRLKKSFKLVHGLSHEHIVRANSLERDNASGLWYVSMDWIEGEDMKTCLQGAPGGKLSPDEAIRILRQVAEALDFAHGKGVVHRDVKCANIMLKPDGNAMLIDFGIAGREATHAVNDGSVQAPDMTASVTMTVELFAGTRGYQSTEQWKGEKATSASDQYSLGVMAYRWLVGHLPFWNLNEGQLQEMVLHDPVPSIRSLPPLAGVVLAKAMAKEPENRYASCVEFIEKLAEGLESDFSWKDFRMLAGRIDNRFRELDESQWDRRQTFGEHLDRFTEACTTAAEAINYYRDDYQAYELYMKADAEWEWLERNTPLREDAAKRRDAVKQPRSMAESLHASQFANDAYQAALRNFKEAQACFENGEFEAASSGFAKAKGGFEAAADAAREGCVRDLERRASEAMAQRRFEGIPGMINEMRGLDAGKASELETAFNTAKNDYILELEAFIKKEIEKHLRFTTAYEALRKLEALDEQEGENWRREVDNAKAEHVKTLVGQIKTAIQEEHFAEAESLIYDLTPLDASEADQWKESLEDTRLILATHLVESISEAVQQERFEEAHNIILRLASVDKDKAAKWETEVHIHELEQAIGDAMSQKRFGDIGGVLQKLTAINPEKAGKWSAEVEAAKAEHISQLEASIEEKLGQNAFADAQEVIGELSVVDAEKGAKWEADVRLHELEQMLSSALAEKRYDDARSTVQELETLNVEKAEEWGGRVETERASYVQSLVKMISEHIALSDFNMARSMVRTLASVDPEEGAKREADIRVHELELALDAAVSEKRFVDAEKAVAELSSLDAAKAEEWGVKSAAAKSSCVRQLLASIAEYIGQKRFSAAKNVVADLASVDEGEAERQQTALDEAKAGRVRELSSSIMEALGKGLVKNIYDDLRELETLDEAEAKKCDEAIKAVKNQQAELLEKSIQDAIAEKRFEDAGKATEELFALNDQKAEEWRQRLDQAKIDYIGELENSISNLIQQGYLEEAAEVVQKLTVMDEAAGEKREEEIRLRRLEKTFKEAVGEKQFDDAQHLVEEIASSDSQRGADLDKELANAKAAYAALLNQQFKETLEQGRLEEAQILMRTLEPFDADMARKCEKRLERAKADMIRRLEKDIKRAIKKGHRADALSALEHLAPLAPEKAKVWEEKIKTVENGVERSSHTIWRAVAVVAIALIAVAVGRSFYGKRLMAEREEAATQAKNAVITEMRKAEDENAEHYAAEDYQKAIELRKNADALFEVGKYVEAKSEYSMAEAAFATAVKTAQANHVSQLSANIEKSIQEDRFTEAITEIEVLKPLDDKKADELARKLAKTKENLVESIEKSIQESLFSEAVAKVKLLQPLDEKKADELTSKLAEAKKNLVESIEKSIQESRFSEAKTGVEILKPLDEKKADELASEVAEAKNNLVDSLLKEAQDALDNKQWQIAYDKSENVLKYDSANSDAKAIKNKSSAEIDKLAFIDQLVKRIEESIEQKHFEQAHGDLQELEQLSTTKADELKIKLNKAEKKHKVTTLLAEAKAAQEANNWQLAYYRAKEVLELDEYKAEATLIKTQAEEELKPRAEIIAVIDGEHVTASLIIGGDKYVTPWTSQTLKNGEVLKGSLVSNHGGMNYKGEFNEVVNWTGIKEITVELKEIPYDGLITLPGGVELKLVKIMPGSFMNTEVNKKITLTREYWLGETEVTQGQYAAIMDGVVNENGESCKPRPSYFKGDDRLPVESVSWYDAMAFCRKLTELERSAGRLPVGYEYSLPTEAQWEYACRAGTTTKWHYGDSLSSKQANFTVDNSNSGTTKGKDVRKTILVKSYKPNVWGLYDMHGNVWEWCRDWYDKDGNYDPETLAGMKGSLKRVFRGGSCHSADTCCCSSHCHATAPSYYNDCRGFRVALVPVNTIILSSTGDVNKIEAGTKTSDDKTAIAETINKKIEYKTITLSDSKELKLVKIDPGSFTNTVTNKRIRLTREYWLGETEVTQGQYASVMVGVKNEKGESCKPRPSYFKGDDRLPVERVSWYDAMAFCKELTRRERSAGRLPSGYEYSLPTEAQWEYACRAGTTMAWCYGSSLSSEQANFDGNYPGGIATKGKYLEKTTPVKSYMPNAWGLYDMHGNVNEWCRDWYDNSWSHDPETLAGMKIGSRRVSRGGSWHAEARSCHSSYRLSYEPAYSHQCFGFRIALVAVDSSK